MKKRLYPNTMMKKFACLLFGAALLLFSFTSLLMNRWASDFLLPLQENAYAVLTEGIATKISYILHQNTQYLLRFARDRQLLEDIEKCSLEGNMQAIIPRLEDETYGSGMEGALRANRSILLCYDRREFFFHEEHEETVSLIRSSPWLREVFTLLDEPSSGAPRMYSPAFTEVPEGLSPFIAYALGTWSEGHEYVFIMFQPVTDFSDLCQPYEAYRAGDWCLLGKDERILIQNKPDSALLPFSPEERSALFHPSQQYTVKISQRGESTVLGSRVSYPAEALKLVTLLPTGDFLLPYQPFKRANILFLAAFTLGLLFLVFYIISPTISRLATLSGQMRLIRQRNLRAERLVTGTDEVGVLGEAFYDMLEELGRDLEIIEQKEQREKEIRYSLMASQVNPHFIYNTLNTITYLAELNKTGDIMIINKALISMLRDRLSITGQEPYDPLGNELAQLENYVTIQKYLCSGNLTLSVDVPEELLPLPFPKNVIQPLAENSILHGILLHRENGKRVPGLIEVSVRRKGERLVTRILDNGTGMTEADIARVFEGNPESPGPSPKKHIGIPNIRLRLDYLYGDQFEIHAEAPPAGGLLVQLSFPVLPLASPPREVR